MDLKTGGYQGLREPRFLLPSLGTSPFAPAVSQHVPAPGRGGRSKSISQATEKKKKKRREGCTRLHFRGSLALFRFQTSFQKCSALVPIKSGHLNPQVNCKALPSHPFRRCPFFRAKQQFKQSVPHASHILFSF